MKKLTCRNRPAAKELTVRLHSGHRLSKIISECFGAKALVVNTIGKRLFGKRLDRNDRNMKRKK